MQRAFKSFVRVICSYSMGWIVSVGPVSSDTIPIVNIAHYCYFPLLTEERHSISEWQINIVLNGYCCFLFANIIFIHIHHLQLEFLLPRCFFSLAMDLHQLWLYVLEPKNGQRHSLQTHFAGVSSNTNSIKPEGATELHIFIWNSIPCVNRNQGCAIVRRETPKGGIFIYN